MITTRLYGRFCNNLFQIAAAVAHAKRNGYQYAIPVNTLNPAIWPNTHHHFKKLNIQDVVVRNRYSEAKPHMYDPIPVHLDNIEIEGYRQSYLYFIDQIEYIRDIFEIPDNLVEGSLCIHFRGKDYFDYSKEHGVMPREYYDKAISMLNEMDVNIKSVTVLTDDIENAKKVFPEYPVYSSDNPIDDFYRMCSAHYLIIANSSYSLLAAILNRNNEKIVFSPDEDSWYGPANSHLYTRDMLPEYFNKIKIIRE